MRKSQHIREEQSPCDMDIIAIVETRRTVRFNTIGLELAAMNGADVSQKEVSGLF